MPAVASSSHHRAMRVVILIGGVALASSAHSDSMRGGPRAAGATAAAHLEFQIVIPSFLIWDTHSGALRTNDKRLTLVTGTFAQTPSAASHADHREQRTAPPIALAAADATIAVRTEPSAGPVEIGAALKSSSGRDRASDPAILLCAP
jgi:hypothetical protein